VKPGESRARDIAFDADEFDAGVTCRVSLALQDCPESAFC
jgi:hypothetical protein